MKTDFEKITNHLMDDIDVMKLQIRNLEAGFKKLGHSDDEISDIKNGAI